jgi:hypothetical protein
VIVLAIWLALVGVWPFAHPDCGRFTPSDTMVVADWTLHISGSLYVYWRYAQWRKNTGRDHAVPVG